jgi:NADPH2:quinone reductase
VTTFSIHGYDDRRERRRNAMMSAIAQFAAGKIDPAISARVPLAEARRAHEMLEGGRALGKILLQP